MEISDNDYIFERQNSLMYDESQPPLKPSSVADLLDDWKNEEPAMLQEEHSPVSDIRHLFGSSDSEGEIRPKKLSLMTEKLKQQHKELREKNLAQQCELVEYEQRLAEKMNEVLKLEMERNSLIERLQASENERLSLTCRMDGRDAEIKQLKSYVERRIAEDADIQVLRKELDIENKRRIKAEKELDHKTKLMQKLRTKNRIQRSMNRRFLSVARECADVLNSKELLPPKIKRTLEQLTEKNQKHGIDDASDEDEHFFDTSHSDDLCDPENINSPLSIKKEDTSDGYTINSTFNKEPNSGSCLQTSDIQSQVNAKTSSLLQSHANFEKDLVFRKTNPDSPITCKVEDASSNEGLSSNCTTNKSSSVLPDSNYLSYKGSKAESVCSDDVEIPNEYCNEIMEKMVLKNDDFAPISPVPSPPFSNLQFFPGRIKTENAEECSKLCMSSQKPSCSQPILSSECKRILSHQMSRGFEPHEEKSKERNTVHSEKASEINPTALTVIPPNLHYISSSYSGDNSYTIVHQGNSVFDVVINDENKQSVTALFLPRASFISNAQNCNNKEISIFPNKEERIKRVLSVYYAAENKVKLVARKIPSSDSSEGDVGSSVNDNYSQICVVVDGEKEFITSNHNSDNTAPPNNSSFATDKELIKVDQRNDCVSKSIQHDFKNNQSYVSSSSKVSYNEKNESFNLPVIVKTSGKYNSSPIKEVYTVEGNNEKMISPTKVGRPRHSSAENPYYLLSDVKPLETQEVYAVKANKQIISPNKIGKPRQSSAENPYSLSRDIKSVGTLSKTRLSSNNVHESPIPISNERLNILQNSSKGFRCETNETPELERISVVSVNSLNNNTLPKFEVPGHENCMTNEVNKLISNESKIEVISPVITSVTSLLKTQSPAKENEEVCESRTQMTKEAIKRKPTFHIMGTSNLTAFEKPETHSKINPSMDIHQPITQNEKPLKKSPFKSESIKLSDPKITSPNVLVDDSLLTAIKSPDKLVLENSLLKDHINGTGFSPVSDLSSSHIAEYSLSETELNASEHSPSKSGLGVSPSEEQLNKCSINEKLHNIDKRQNMLNKSSMENSTENVKDTIGTFKRKSKNKSKLGKGKNNLSDVLKKKINKKGTRGHNVHDEASFENLPGKTLSAFDKEKFQQGEKNLIPQLQNNSSVKSSDKIYKDDYDKMSSDMNFPRGLFTVPSTLQTKAEAQTLSAIKNVNDYNLTSSKSGSILNENDLNSDPEISTHVKADIHINEDTIISNEDTSKIRVVSELEKFLNGNTSSGNAHCYIQVKLVEGDSNSKTEVPAVNGQQQPLRSPKKNLSAAESEMAINFRDDDTLIYSPTSNKVTMPSKCNSYVQNSYVPPFSNVFEKPNQSMPLESDSVVEDGISENSILQDSTVKADEESKVSVNKREAVIDSHQVSKISARRCSIQSSISENESPLVIVEDVEEKNKSSAETSSGVEEINQSDADNHAENSSSELTDTPERKNSGKRKRNKTKAPSLSRKKKPSPSIKSNEEVNNVHNIQSVLEEIKRIKIEDLQTNHSHSKMLVHSLVNVLINPSNAVDTKSLLFQMFDYLSTSKLNPLTSFMVHQNISVFYPPSELCIFQALIKVDRKKKNHLQKLISSAITTLYHLIILKHKISKYGLSAFCRIFTQLCKYTQDSDKPLMLCSNLLRLNHPYGPFLIASIVGVWHELFSITDDTQENELLLLSAISYGVKKKIPTLNSNDWKQCKALFSVCMNVLPIPNASETTKVAIEKLSELVNESPDPKDYLVTEPLLIMCAQEGWLWIQKNVLHKYLVPQLLVYAKKENNERAFCLLAELFVDIGMCECAKEELGAFIATMLQFFKGTDVLEYVNDAAAKYLLKLLLFKKHSLELVENWVAANNKKLEGTIVYSWLEQQSLAIHDTFTATNDIIID